MHQERKLLGIHLDGSQLWDSVVSQSLWHYWNVNADNFRSVFRQNPMP